MKKRVTIKDIAKDLNISTSTVSRALIDSWDVKPETRRKVLEAAGRLNYRPNFLAKNLHGQRTGTIGIITPEFVSSFFTKIILGIQEVLSENNYNLLITQSGESREEELKNLHLLENNMVDGILLSITREGSNEAEYERIIKNGIPIVFFNRACKVTNAPKVLINDRQMAFHAVEHLVQSGYKRIAHFSGPAALSLTNERKSGYLEALTKYGYEIDESLIIETGVLMEKGHLAMQQLFSSSQPLPDAIFAFNDPVAIGAMKEIKKQGLRIPEDIALAGFSESMLALVVEPQLTSVLQPLYEMGRQSATLLLQQLQATRPVKPESIYLEAELNIRASSLQNSK